MRLVAKIASIDPGKCIRCGICARVCTTAAIQMTPAPIIDSERCAGCANCEQRCPQLAISMHERTESRLFRTDPSRYPPEALGEMCRRAHLNPEQVICVCTGTRANEVAAAILDGYDTPEEIALHTGVRTGCKVLCIEPVLRLLKASGREEQPAGLLTTLWDLTEEQAISYARYGYAFDKDRHLMDALVQAEGGKEAQ